MVRITGATGLYVIIGDPIAQVLSPTLFNAAFDRLNLDAVLVPLQVGAEHLDQTLRALRDVKNLEGM